ncbi:MAG TPA: MASE1 domain-containing protein [Bryobacteraceae bacterium]|nr:MASE1 domain-containing protein [Bryobacteraceae bacterium]
MKSTKKKETESYGRIVLQVFLTGVAYYAATEIAWALCFPNSKVSLLFPPHAVLVVILLLVPVRHWWAYTLATGLAHFVATQQAHWPVLYALHCEAFDAVQNVLAAAGIRFFIKSPLRRITLRDAMVFVLIAVIIVPFGAAFWGAAFTVSNHFGTHYWVEWRNLGISNGVTAVVLVPALLLLANRLSGRAGRPTPARVIEGSVLALGIVVVGTYVFAIEPAGPDTSPALLYAPIPLLIWAALRFGLSGISAAMLVVTFEAIWGAMHGRGPFLLQTPAENALALQMFLIVTGTPLMFLSVLLEDDKRSQQALHEVEEEARRHREQINLLSRVSLLGEMTASLAHELNQPLSAIITNANAGKRSIDKGKEDPGTLREILVDVEADGRRAHDIIRNARNTIKKSDPTLYRINLNELVTKVAHMVRLDAVAYSCEIETALAKDLPPVEVDPVQIQQVLVNLVSNAFDAMRQTPPDRRKVEISTAGNGENEVRLSVRDHGTGIRTEVHERLFDRFFTTKEQGLGMGLAIVRSIVESHGGKIDAENVAGGGALFYFTLPVTKKT